MEIRVLEDVRAASQQAAAESRELFRQRSVFVVNVMGSPGAGKTLLIQRSLRALMPRFEVGVVVGDICTTRDAERLSLDGRVPVVQICTERFGGDCHLAPQVVRDAVDQLDLERLDILVIENVGNLVCPAEFDIGEDKRVVVLSTGEGEDKPIKYPLMFRVCDATVLSKIDLVPHLDYDTGATLSHIRSVKAAMPVFELSATTGAGFDAWLEWLTTQAARGK